MGAFAARSPSRPRRVLGCLWRTPDHPEGAAQADRLMELAIDGFRP
ncbi:hypothetical protein ACGFY7_34315 [Streptomyces prunicolor]